MARNFSLDNRVWASNGDRTDPDTVTTSEANLLNVADGHIDSQGPFSDIMNWEQHRVSQMLNDVEQSGIMEWSSKTQYKKGGLARGEDGQIYQSRKESNKNHPLSDTSWWIEYFPTGMGDMLASTYDKNGNGIVDKSASIDGIDSAVNSSYYGKDASGNIGFHAVPPDGDMKKSVYDTNNNGRVDLADSVHGVNSAGASKYYGTNQNGQVGFYNLPPNGDMLTSIYDTNGSGRVDIAESIFGVNAAQNLAYYGKDENGSIGFFNIIDTLPVYATRWPTAEEAGALPSTEQAVDSKLLDGRGLSFEVVADSVPSRNDQGDIKTRLFQSTYPTETDVNSISATGGIAFRNNVDTDNGIKFANKATLKKWLAITKSDIGLPNVQNYPISHVASLTEASKVKYASEFAVNAAYTLAQRAFDAASTGGVVDLAKKAQQLEYSRVIALAGDVVGSVNFNGSQNVSMTTTVADNSHNHLWANISNPPETATRWPVWSEVSGRPDMTQYAKLDANVSFGRILANELRCDSLKDSGGATVIEPKATSDLMQFGVPFRKLRLRAKDTPQLINEQNEITKLYHEGFKPTPADIGALPSTTTANDINAVDSKFGWGTKQAYTVADADSDPNTWNTGAMGIIRFISSTQHLPNDQTGVGILTRYMSQDDSYFYLTFEGPDKTYRRLYTPQGWSDWFTLIRGDVKGNAVIQGNRNGGGNWEESALTIGDFAPTILFKDLSSNATDNVALMNDGGRLYVMYNVPEEADGLPTADRRGVVYSSLNPPTAQEVGAEPTLSDDRKRKITMGTTDPVGGSDGDIYLQYA